MKKIVSFFGERSDAFVELNRRADEYAAQRKLSYRWAPQAPFDQQSVISLLRESDAGIIDVEPYGEDIFSKVCDSCRIMVRFGVGYDKVDLKSAERHGIAIARTTGANTAGVAEMALSLIMASRRQLRQNQMCVETGEWRRNVTRETILGTVGIVGFGAIGQKLTRLFKGFDCTVVAYDPFPRMDIVRELGVKMVRLEELFETSDAISLHLPYSLDTHNLVAARLLSLMKPTAVIVNTARGKIIDEQALYECLASRRIAGAGLDVYAQEPLPLDSPLLKLDNIVLTPHVSSQTFESLWRVYEMAIDIAADFFDGKESEHILNPDYKINAGTRR